VLHTTKPVRTTETISGMPEAIRDNNPSLSATAGVEKSEVTEQNINRETNQPSEPTAANKENNSRQKEFIKNGTDTIKKVRDYQISVGETGKEHSIPPREKTLTPPPAEVQSNHLALPMPNRVYHLNELPLPIRQTLPEFLVSVFLYSDDPASRLVRINGQMMKEGQYLAPGVKLEEIVPAGVIFNYQNYRFLIGPK